MSTIAAQVPGYHYTNIPKDMIVKSYGNQYGSYYVFNDGSRVWFQRNRIDKHFDVGICYLYIG